MSNAVNQTERKFSDSDGADHDLSSFPSFIDSFPLQGNEIYRTLFESHADLIQTQKEKFAIVNLEKILTATFEISSISGFEKMSLRDLSKRTGMSMGAIYSCISKKEDIALMVADTVRLSNELTQEYALQSKSNWSQIEQSIKFHLYASSVLQPWYFFLYFETRSLPDSQQLKSKQIELDAIDSFKTRIEDGANNKEFFTDNPEMVANMVVVMLEDWYLKPWKNHSASRTRQSIKQQEIRINNYCQALISMLRKILI